MSRPVAYVLIAVSAWSICAAAEGPPKYGAAAVRLFAAREYVRRHDAPDFWALVPYYLPQGTDSSCSAACVAMLVNAARADQERAAGDELATEVSLLRRVNRPVWTAAVAAGGAGVTLDQLRELIGHALRAYGVTRFKIETVHVRDESAETRAAVRRVLERNERSGRDFLLVNYRQSDFTGDPSGAMGHFAPVAAYDAERRRVLIFDPDRQWYEPHWVAEDAFVAGMATRDPDSGQPRGYIHVRLLDE